MCVCGEEGWQRRLPLAQDAKSPRDAGVSAQCLHMDSIQDVRITHKRTSWRCSIASPCHVSLRHLNDAFPHTTWRTNNVSQTQLHRYISPTRDGIPRRFRHGPKPIDFMYVFHTVSFCIILGDSCFILGDIYRDPQEERRLVHGACAGKSEGRMFLLGRFKPETRIEELASGSSWSVASHHRARLRGKHDGRMAELYGQECPSAFEELPHR